MEPNVTSYFSELMVGLVLLGFAAAFRNWSTTVRESTEKILEEMKNLAQEFHIHKLQQENRVTRIETEVDSVMRRLDFIDLDRADQQRKNRERLAEKEKRNDA